MTVYSKKLRSVILILCLFLSFSSFAQQRTEPQRNTATYKTAPPDTKPQKLKNGLLQFGLATINMRSGEIRFPARLAPSQGISNGDDYTECLIVTNDERAHESIFRSPVSPFHINTLLLLANGKSLQEGKKSSTIDIDVIYKDSKGQERSEPIENFFWDSRNKRCPERNGFTFKGSQIIKGFFQAEGSGDLISLYKSPYAVLETKDPRVNSDDVFTFHPHRQDLLINQKFTISIKIRKEI